MSGDTLRQQAVGPSYEVELSSRRTLVFQIVEQRAVVGQMGNIKSDPGSHLRLEMCLALESPTLGCAKKPEGGDGREPSASRRKCPT